MGLPVEQLYAAFTLETSDLLRDRGLGHIQMIRSPAHTHELAEIVECFEMLEVHSGPEKTVPYILHYKAALYKHNIL
jgi:hypothetical protein